MSTLPKKFWAKVTRAAPSLCWRWQGGVDKHGYGYFSIRIARNKTIRRSAHKYAYELTHGPIPSGKVVRHLKCDNRVCCNPAHLALGTKQDNSNDMVRAGRSLGGQRGTSAKLTNVDVRAIRKALAVGATQAAQARLYGVHRSAVHRIAKGETYR